MAPQYVRFLIEEVLENRIGFYPTYGNTLMGLAASVPLRPEDNFSVTYYAPQPRAVLRVVDPKQTDSLVDYDQWGRVELTTLTKEFFMPRFLERDEALRRRARVHHTRGTASPRCVPSAPWRKQLWKAFTRAHATRNLQMAGAARGWGAYRETRWRACTRRLFGVSPNRVFRRDAGIAREGDGGAPSPLKACALWIHRYRHHLL